jgi:hypothetical protein
VLLSNEWGHVFGEGMDFKCDTSPKGGRTGSSQICQNTGELRCRICHECSFFRDGWEARLRCRICHECCFFRGGCRRRSYGFSLANHVSGCPSVPCPLPTSDGHVTLVRGSRADAFDSRKCTLIAETMSCRHWVSVPTSRHWKFWQA